MGQGQIVLVGTAKYHLRPNLVLVIFLKVSEMLNVSKML